VDSGGDEKTKKRLRRREVGRGTQKKQQDYITLGRKGEDELKGAWYQ